MKKSNGIFYLFLAAFLLLSLSIVLLAFQKKEPVSLLQALEQDLDFFISFQPWQYAMDTGGIYSKRCCTSHCG